MKKLPIFLLVTAFSASLLMGSVQPTQGSSDTNNKHKVGLIDMAKVFKEYKKFTSQREVLKKEIELKQVAYKSSKDRILTLQKKIADKQITNSADKQRWEKEFFDLKAKYESKLKQDEIEFMRREAAIYKEIYQEVQASVKLYAGYYGYAVILRYSSEGLAGADDPRKILDKMNRLVVFSTPDVDITEHILTHLNKNYGGSANRSPNTRRN